MARDNLKKKFHFCIPVRHIEKDLGQKDRTKITKWVTDSGGVEGRRIISV
jgi:hypothetical protein